jgi:arginase
VGELAGLKDAMKGRAGMVWIDSHGDFNIPGTTPSGYIGGMCLALACGRGPKLSPEVDAAMPLIEEERLVHLGSRVLDESELRAMKSSPMRMVPTSGLKKRGVAAESTASSKWLSDRCDWIVCHLDVDVMDPMWMPSVNYPTPNGITPDEAVRLIASFVATGKLAVLDVAAYNAGLDREGKSARVVVDVLSRAFQR